VCAPQPHVLVLDEPTNHLGAQLTSTPTHATAPNPTAD
jgi:ABC-type sulfate/molybdate transport systems ATPase subunit